MENGLGFFIFAFERAEVGDDFGRGIITEFVDVDAGGD